MTTTATKIPLGFANPKKDFLFSRQLLSELKLVKTKNPVGNSNRILIDVGNEGFEPPTPWV